MGGDKLSVTWCQPIGLMHVVGWEGECGSRRSFEDRRSVRKEILTGAVARHRKTSAGAK